MKAPIYLGTTGSGVTETVVSVHVSAPDEECETQQLMDFGVVRMMMADQHADISFKIRFVSAYSDRWSIPIERIPARELHGMIEQGRVK